MGQAIPIALWSVVVNRQMKASFPTISNLCTTLTWPCAISLETSWCMKTQQQTKTTYECSNDVQKCFTRIFTTGDKENSVVWGIWVYGLSPRIHRGITVYFSTLSRVQLLTFCPDRHKSNLSTYWTIKKQTTHLAKGTSVPHISRSISPTGCPPSLRPNGTENKSTLT